MKEQDKLDILEMYKVEHEGIEHVALRILHNGDRYCIGLSGSLENLAMQYLDGNCTLGILLDFLEENPEQFGLMSSSQAMVPQIVAAFRRAYPDALFKVMEKE